ncbi:uncharacterized protein LOC143359008 [Halictus rubicundus]|uniref:uncharacterized protein LOC143359008 n=1 Tax=Halictus rubicundus TaxID=77578 RepID=UPI004035959C
MLTFNRKLKMVDLQGQDTGNISLPLKLQSYQDGKPTPTIINMQRAFYDIRIEDIENRIKRLKDRNDELSEGMETTNELMLTVDAETADEIATLTKQVNSQNSRIENLKNQINKLENDRIQDRETHNNNIQLCQRKYTLKKLELVSKIKILNAKINGLQDFKKVQSSLLEKLEENKERMIKYEKEVKEILEGIRRKFEFDKEMLKLELYNYLLDLAAHFQIETNKFISLPNKRLMRENIMLQKELSQLSKVVSIKRKIEIDCKITSVNHTKDIVTEHSNAKRNIVTYKVQHSVLKALQSRYERMKEQLSGITAPDPTAESKLLIEVDHALIQKQNTKFILSKFQTLLHKEKAKITVAMYLQRRIDCKIKAVVETLYDVKYTVARLLQCPEIESNYPKLLSCLKYKVSKGELRLRCNTVPSVETIPRATDCRPEDVKDIPDDVDLEILTVSVKSRSSYSAILDNIKSESSGEEATEMSTQSSVPDKKELDDIFDTVTLSNEEEYGAVKETEFLDDDEQSFVIKEE